MGERERERERERIETDRERGVAPMFVRMRREAAPAHLLRAL